MDDIIFPLVVIPVLITGYIVAPVITALKGRSELLVIGVFFHPVWWVGAFLLAKPNSWWARKLYDGEKLAQSQRRYPQPAPPVPYWQANHPPAAPAGSTADQDRPSDPPP
ncbi:hypothetical protein [Flindersiella endophytica]